MKILEILRICLFADVLASLDLFPFACLPEIIAVARVNCRFILPSVGFTIFFFSVEFILTVANPCIQAVNLFV